MNFDSVLFVQLLWAGINAGAFYALMAFGFALIYYTTRILHFAHGAVVILLSYVIYALADSAGLPWPVAAILAVPVGALLGMAIEMLVYRPIRHRGQRDVLPGSALFIGSLGVGLMIVNIIPLVYGTTPKYLSGGIIVDSVLLWNDQIALTYVSLVTIPGAIVLLGLLMVWLQKSGQGRTIRAVIDNPETSRIVGLKVERTNLLVLALGSALAASAATILLVSRGADSQADNFMVITIAAALIGGIGSMAGVLAGAFIVGIVSNVALMWLPSAYGQATIYVALLLFIVARPQGLLGHRTARRA